MKHLNTLFLSEYARTLHITILSIAFFIASTHFTKAQNNDDYCIPVYNVACTSGIDISNVTLSGESVTLENNTGCSGNNYGDYTNLTPPDLLPGETYTLTIGSDYQLAEFNEVKIWIDYNDNASFEADEKIADTDGNGMVGGFTNLDFTVPQTSTPGNYRMRVKLVYVYTDFDACSEEDSGEAEDYTVEILSEDTCPEPTAINFSVITSSSAGLSWTENGSATEWEVVYGPVDFNPEDDGTTITVQDNPQTTLENLEPDSNYNVYVRAICGAGNNSDFTGPEILSTLMAPCDAPTDVAFDYITDNSVGISWSPGGDETEWVLIYGLEGFDPNMEGTTVSVTDTPNYTLSGLEPITDYDVYLKAICESGDGGDPFTQRFSVNESDLVGPVTFTTMAPCDAPTDITFDNITDNSADVTWTPGGDETEWELIYGFTGFNPNGLEGVGVLVSETPDFILTELEPNTTYDVYVKAICENGNESDPFTQRLSTNESDLTGPATFTTATMSVENPLFESFTFYPNPVDEQLTLKAETTIKSVAVYNLLGKMIMTETPHQLQTQLNTKSLQSGIYLMKVILDGSTKTFRVVKD